MDKKESPLTHLLPALDQLAQKALALWDLPGNARATRINVSENVTYLVQAPSFKSILRIHRHGYNSPHAIACELDWLTALGRDADVTTPRILPGRDGARIQHASIKGIPAPRFMVMFTFLDGAAPDENDDLAPGFEELGAIAAKCHSHALTWPRPTGFERLTWDETTVFGPQATWGNWRDAPGVTREMHPLLDRLETTVTTRLRAFGKSPDRFNLIHGDMRLANLIIGPAGTQLIDFDDCGFGWFLYDFAAAISFMETDPRIPDLKAAWLRGYRSLRALPPEDEAEIDTFIMLRRMALLAWIGSHIDAPEPQALAPHFADGTAQLAKDYLSR